MAQCDAGLICPGGTRVAPECTNPAGFNGMAGNPCVCTALLDLAGLSSSERTGSPLPTVSPWNDLSTNSYCQNGNLKVTCVSVPGGNVALPDVVQSATISNGLEGAVLPSIVDLGPMLTFLQLKGNWCARFLCVEVLSGADDRISGSRRCRPRSAPSPA